MRLGDKFQISFYFLKTLNMRQKQVICNLASIYFNSPQLDLYNALDLTYNQSKLCKTLDY